MSFYLPAEWHPQSAVQLTWPHQTTDWAPILEDILQVYLHLSKHITERQLLLVSFHNDEVKQDAEQRLSDFGVDLTRVRSFVAPSNDTWARDHGPITLIDNNGDAKVLDFNFNAWGSKYESNFDDQITMQLIQQPFVEFSGYENIDMVLEGGSIESDGHGTLLTTEKCLLNENRNPDMSKDEIEAALKQVFDAKRVLWLQHGFLSGDDTDAHIDTLARLAPQGIVYVSCTDPSDPHYDELKAMEAELERFTDNNGQSYTLFPLPWPKPIFDDDGSPLPATYANYLIINDAVLVPTYNDENDATALEIIGRAHPNRDIIGVDCTAVIKQFGSLHCLTMQLPKGLII